MVAEATGVIRGMAPVRSGDGCGPGLLVTAPKLRYPQVMTVGGTSFLRWTDRATRRADAMTVERRRADTFRLLVGALPFALLIFETWYLWSHWSPLPPDAFTYLAAGERLNAGHSLYGPLGPGDRPLPFASLYAAPILSPPLIAVVWRPLALFGGGSVYLWWLATTGALYGAIVVLWSRSPLAAGTLVLLAVYPLAIETGAANLNSLVLAGTVVIWYLWQHDRIGMASGLAVAMAAVKVLPVFLVIWLLAVAPRRAWRPCLAASALLVTISVLGAGFEAHLDYLSVLTSTAESNARLPLVVAMCTAAILSFRRHPAIAYVFAVMAMAVAWASVLVIALAAPLAFPVRQPARAAGSEGAAPSREGARAARPA